MTRSFHVVVASGLLLVTAAAAAGETPATISVSGHVIASEGPVANAKVYLHIPSTRPHLAETAREVGRTTTDGSFTFQIDTAGLAGRRWRATSVVVFSPEHAVGWRLLSRTRDLRDLTVELGRPTAVWGVVRNDKGDLISGAEVSITELLAADPIRPRHQLTSTLEELGATTDKQGQYAIKNLPETSIVSLDISADGYATTRQSAIRVRHEWVVSTLIEQARIKGRLTYGDTGDSVVNVGIRAHGSYPVRWAWSRTTTDDDGRYYFDRLPVAGYTVFVEKVPGWTAAAKRVVTVSERTVSRVDLSLVKGGLVSGRVTEKGTGMPVPGWVIGVQDEARPMSQREMHLVTTDTSGHYRFRAPAGRVLLRMDVNPETGYAIAPNTGRRIIELEEGEVVEGLDFQLVRGEVVRGTVLSPAGEPVAGIHLKGASCPECQSWFGETLSDDGGGFAINGLEADKILTVLAECEQLQLNGHGSIVPGVTSEMTIQLERYELARATGRVLDNNSRPMAGVEVLLGTMRDGPWPEYPALVARTDRSGQYHVDRLPVGGTKQYLTLIARVEGHKDAEIPLAGISRGANGLPITVMRTRPWE